MSEQPNTTSDPRPPAPPLAISAGPLIAGTLLALALLHVLFGGQRTAFEDAALGAETSTYIAFEGADPIHCLGLDEAEQCLAGVRARGRRTAALWLGNSQVHAINQMQAGDETAPAIAHRALADRDIDLVAFTYPNANLQEHYVSFEHLRHQLPLSTVIVHAVYDDTRETGVRHRLAPAFDDPQTSRFLEATATGRRLRAEHAAAPEAAGEDPMAALDQTVQERTETWLNDALGNAWPLWEARAEARGSLFLWLYRLRNTLFGITAQTTRPRIQNRYDDNLAALRDLLEVGASAGIRVIVYIAPLRDDVPPPYVPDEYTAFKADVRRIAAEGGATLLDLEHVVAAELWGQKDPTTLGGAPELDFMHFQAAGHRRVADAIVEQVSRGAQ